MVARPWPDIVSNDELPPYLIEPPPTTGWDLHHLIDSLSRVRPVLATPPRVPAESALPVGGRTPTVSGLFFRMVPLPRDGLAAVLAAWWAAEAKAGTVTVDRRLQLEPPAGDATIGWTLHGRLRRFTTLHWVPVTVELSPTLANFTIMTMEPGVHIHTSKRYFRIGHAVMDRLYEDLAEISAQTRSSKR